MRREIKAIVFVALTLLPLSALAQDEGPREINVPNPMGVHTWFIIVAVGAFLAWCISYALQLQKEKLAVAPDRRSLLRRKEELLSRLAELEEKKEAGTIGTPRYEKEFKKAKGQLSEILVRLSHKQDSPET